ncbi:MAG: hypothetical protein HYX63_11660 [Gammaproteobacteria bacterium]|nr:hypothetical protein [Gammaproteobacteria bacterium]
MNFNRTLAVVLMVSNIAPMAAYELYNANGLHADGTVNLRLGLRQGENINFGVGALRGFGTLGRTTGETSRTDLETAIRPGLTAAYELSDSEIYGGVTAVAAATTLDGELSGQFARSGDRVLNSDAAYVGWRSGVLDVSYGAQPFTLGDGFVVGDGNFNQGHDNGQYWIGAFESWRNTAVVKINTSPIRADLFWLRTDKDLGGTRVAGFNFENPSSEVWGKLSAMYFEIVQDDRAGRDGMQVWGFRGGDLHWPSLPAFKLYGEYVREGGRARLTGISNDADAWYIEPTYQVQSWPWTPRFYYRYARYSGDNPATAENEEYRGLFFTLGKRDWDTWYQGEINGEFFLFNENQRTHMLKVKTYPNQRCAVMAMYYHHELEQPQYFGVPTRSTAWSDELNLEFEFYPTERLYGLAGIAWATPKAAAKQIFGDRNQLVFELFLSYTFK